MKAVKTATPYRYDLGGGELCLDFANTVSYRFDPARRLDHLTDYPAVVAFLEQSAVLEPAEARELERDAGRSTKRAGKVFAAAIVLREAIYSIFSSLAAGSMPDKGEIKTLNSFLREALAHRRIRARQEGFHWGWARSEEDPLGHVLWPVAVSAADLLITGRRESVRACAEEKCRWLFLDHSRNGSRRWCDMKVCGNRVKARRHYQQSRA